MSVRTLIMNREIYFIAFSLLLNLVTGLATACPVLTSPRMLEIALAPILPDDIDSKAIGEVLYSNQGTLSNLTGQSTLLGCAEDEATAPLMLDVSSTMQGAEVALSTWQTSVPGLGLRISFIDNSAGQNQEARFAPFNFTRTLSPGNSLITDELQVKIEIIKTGELSGQENFSWQQPTLLRFYAPQLGETQVRLTMNATLPPPRCNFSMPSAMLSLESVSLHTLREQHVSVKTPWRLLYVCSRKPAMASLTVDGEMLDADVGIFRPRSGDKQAQDVGLQIWFGEQAMATGKVFSLDSINPTSGGVYSVPLSVNYVLAGKSPKPGEVNMTVTLKLNYL